MKKISISLKLIIFGLSTIILLSASSIVVLNNIKNNTDITQSNNKIVLSSNYKKPQLSSAYSLINNLTDVSSYLIIVKQTQKSLLYKINHSAFHTLQGKHNLFIHHNYIKEANNNIKISNDSISKENQKLVKIIEIVKDHPSDYVHYLEMHNYKIPNYSFFINYNVKNKGQLNNIKNNSYETNKSNDLNNISTASEEASFGAKYISKSSLTVMKTIFRDFNFNANIISFNVKKNLFEFKKLETANTNKNNSSELNSIKNNKFLSSDSKIKSKTLNLKNNSMLINIISNDIYPSNFNFHDSQCYKTRLDIGNDESFSNNIITYVVLPFGLLVFIGLSAVSIKYGLPIVSKFVRGTSKKSINSSVRFIKTNNYITYSGDSEDSRILVKVDGLDSFALMLHKHSANVENSEGQNLFSSRAVYNAELKKLDEEGNIVKVKVIRLEYSHINNQQSVTDTDGNYLYVNVTDLFKDVEGNLDYSKLPTENEVLKLNVIKSFEIRYFVEE